MYNVLKNAKKIQTHNSTTLRAETKSILASGTNMPKCSAKPGGETALSVSSEEYRGIYEGCKGNATMRQIYWREIREKDIV